MESLLKDIHLSFSPEFLTWVCVCNYETGYRLDFYTNGWEL